MLLAELDGMRLSTRLRGLADLDPAAVPSWVIEGRMPSDDPPEPWLTRLAGALQVI